METGMQQREPTSPRKRKTFRDLREQGLVTDTLLTIMEACEVLRITRRGLYKMMAEGRVKWVMIGTRTRRIRASEVERIIRGGAIESTADKVLG